MSISILRLKIEKGPKSGETLICKPEKVISIGRVIKGNTFTIKDSGISQKHLRIYFLPEISRWILKDLGSSNGTYINGFFVPPDEPYSLSDGDSIKIGEKTSISVNIYDFVDQIHVNVEENVDEVTNNGRRTRGRGRSNRVSRNSKVLDPVQVEPRMTRSLAKIGSNRDFVKNLNEDDVVMFSDLVDVVEMENISKGENVVVVDGENNSNVDEKNAGVEEVEDNMDKMTLGEWFDRMEEYLPKSINKVAEEIIEKLREKGRLFDEYVSQTSDVLVE